MDSQQKGAQNLGGYVLALRAVAAEFAKRIYVPVVVALSILAVLITAFVVYLTSMNALWWILAAVVIAWDIVFTVGFLIAGLILRVLNPQQKATQRKAVRLFVDKLQGLSEITQTPKVILLFRLVRDIVSRRDNGFIQSTIDDTTSLKKDFTDLVNTFNQ